MKQKALRFRQVHLDFHTAPSIPGVGDAFDKAQFQKHLKLGHVDSITVFSACHHGWSYHPTSVGAPHPHLHMTDLLRAQMDACKEIDVRTPVYLTAGVNNRVARLHPEWREIDFEGRYAGWAKSPLEAGFHTLCFNSPYLDYLCSLIEETVQRYPEADGIFLDIISQTPCCCPWCLESMAKKGFDATKEADRVAHSREVLQEYYRRTTASVQRFDPAMPVFHNSGHIEMGNRNLGTWCSHLELESLPTGGWGYDHFPMSARYAEQWGQDFLGMTGKFHNTWGEFGGFKHPNALRYECAAMLAYGAKCSVGDQLHPSGALDEETYRIIGEAYAEVEAKEPWCRDSRGIADLGLLSCAAVNALRSSHLEHNDADTGANRLLLELHYLYDILDTQSEFSHYKLIIVPDDAHLGPDLVKRLSAYVAKGGKLLLTGTSGLDHDGKPLLDFGGTTSGPSPFEHDFVPFPTPTVMYLGSQRLKITDGTSVGGVYDPYFNRTYEHFCSHQHAPNERKPSGFASGAIKGNTAYLAHRVFTAYLIHGTVSLKAYVAQVLSELIGSGRSFQAELPSTARVTLRHQPNEKRFVLHLLHAIPLARGENRNGTTRQAVQVIEDLHPLAETKVTLRLAQAPVAARLVPQGRSLPVQTKAGVTEVTVPGFSCHQMVELNY